MIELQFRIICYGLALILMLITYTLWRLERVAGADRRLVTQAAQRSEEQGGEEQRSVEDRRVTPGEVREALEWAKSIARVEAVSSRCGLKVRVRDCRTDSMKTLARQAAEKWEQREKALASLLPEPDSDAVTPDGVDTTEGIPSANPLGNSCGERSGRRNSNIERTKGSDNT